MLSCIRAQAKVASSELQGLQELRCHWHASPVPQVRSALLGHLKMDKGVSGWLADL